MHKGINLSFHKLHYCQYQSTDYWVDDTLGDLIPHQQKYRSADSHEHIDI